MKKNALNVLLSTDLFWKWRETWSRIPKTRTSSFSKWRVQRMGFPWLPSILGRESSARPVMDPLEVSDLAALLPAVASKVCWLPCYLLFIYFSFPFFFSQHVTLSLLWFFHGDVNMESQGSGWNWACWVVLTPIANAIAIELLALALLFHNWSSYPKGRM